MSTNTCPTPPRISLSLIRDFQLHHDGALIELPPNSQRLVCFLAFQDRPVRRSYVSGTLWFNSDEYRASASLRSALWRLPSMPGLDLVGSSHSHIWLGPDVTIDIREVIERMQPDLPEPLPLHDDPVVVPADEHVVTEGHQLPGHVDQPGGTVRPGEHRHAAPHHLADVDGDVRPQPDVAV